MFPSSAAGAGLRHRGKHPRASDKEPSSPPSSGLREASGQPDQLDEKDDDTTKKTFNFLSNQQRIRSLEAYFIALELEPPSVRADRIISVFDTMTVFGALYFGVIFSLREYGGNAPTQNVVANRLFHFSNALGLISTSFLSMFSSFLWIASILFSNSNATWVSSARPVLSLNIAFVTTIFVTTIVSTGIAVFGQFSMATLEQTLLLGFLGLVVGRCMYTISYIFAKEIPLEYVNLPRLYTLLFFPFPWFTARSRRDLHHGAQKRALCLQQRQTQLAQGVERTQNKVSGADFSDVTSLLICAVQQTDRSGVDVTPFVQQLEKEWFDSVESLKGLSPDQLAGFMPLRLAMQVCQLIKKK